MTILSYQQHLHNQTLTNMLITTMTLHAMASWLMKKLPTQSEGHILKSKKKATIAMLKKNIAFQLRSATLTNV